ncbi:hypothetical protein [uncultured Roseovarius sp.]|uniref:hypothetical protein n=1 Tax=uncultured Roseovarius sp. TaxID=293344 RepID=UPI002593D964|nr:hypothetical protein [uncultured Roseovarius sp.]
MKNQIEQLKEYATELEGCVITKHVNVRLMYTIRGYSTWFPAELANAVDSIFKSFDDNTARGLDDSAISDMDKILGLIEGIKRAEESNFNALQEELIPTFSLNQSDKERVLKLCGEMRKIVLATEDFDQAHRRRLLNRISGIEHQVEQPSGLLDVVRAGVSDVGETLGKFGKDIEPLTKRMQEVANIARKNSKQYEKIPAPEDVKQLPKPEEDEQS